MERSVARNAWLSIISKNHRANSGQNGVNSNLFIDHHVPNQRSWLVMLY